MQDETDFLSSALGVPAPEPAKEPEAQKPAEPIKTEPVKTEPTPQAPAATEPDKKPEIDFSSLLREKTGGKIESEEQLQKFFEINDKYATLDSEASQLRSKLEQFETQAKDRYANPLVEMLDDLYRKGATDSQIQTALQLQSLDIDAMDGLEAKTRRLMFEKGWTRDEALEEINAVFKLDESKYEPEDIEKDKRRIERNKSEDIKFLAELKKEATAISNGPDPEKQRLAEQQKAEHQAKVSSFATAVASQHSGLGSLELLPAKENEEGISLEIKFNDDFQKLAPEYAKQYMLQQGITPSEESAPTVKKYLNQVYFAAYGEDIVKTAVAHAESTLLKRITEQNANRGGGNRNQNPIPDAKKEADNDFLRSWALGRG